MRLILTHLIQSVSHSTQSIFHSIQFTLHADSSWSSKIINCPFNFTPVSVTIFSVFWQKSCYRLTNAANFRPPLTFDASRCERRESSTRSSPLGCHATLRHSILFGGDSTPFTKRSQHFATESTFHRKVNISPQRQVKRLQPFHYRVDF